jgi:hypothetical protein
VTAGDVAEWIQLLTTPSDHGGHALLEYGDDGRLRFPPHAFYRYQTYIPPPKRSALEPGTAPSINSASATAKSAEISEKLQHQEKSAEISEKSLARARPSVTPSPSPSPSTTPPAATQPTEWAPSQAPDALVPLALVPVEEPAALSRPAPKPAEEHPFRELWGAFDEVFGLVRSRTEKNRRAAACKDAREGHATGEEIRRAAANWANVMGDASMSEHAIVANLGKLLEGPQVNGRSNGTVTAHTQHLRELATVNRGPKRGSAALDDEWRLSDHAQPGGE